jgi:hypothetical protein
MLLQRFRMRAGVPLLQSRFHDPLLQPISSISPSASAASRFSGKFRKTKKRIAP